MLSALIGRKFARLAVVKKLKTVKSNQQVLCRCECGKEIAVFTNNLRRCHSQSCGCLKTELLITRSRTHGHTPLGRPSPSYRSYSAMLRRCYNPNSRGYRWYGACGVTVCEQWRRSFETFLSDMRERPEGHVLSRAGDTGDYTPKNCRWIPSKENIRERHENHRHSK